MLFMSVYKWLLTKNQRKAYSFIKLLTVSELKKGYPDCNKNRNKQSGGDTDEEW